MFYEEGVIKSILKCTKCTNSYDKQEEPRILPCGKSICINCLSEIEYEIEDRKFDCNLCSERHSLPKNGFPKNDLLIELLRKEPAELYRGAKYEELKSSLKSIQKIFNKIQFNYNNGDDLIKEHCLEQRRLIQLATEEKKLELDKCHDRLINRMDIYERDCIASFHKNQSFSKEFTETMNRTEKFVTETQLYLKKPKVDEKIIKSFSLESDGLYLDLYFLLKRGENVLFNNNILKFESDRLKHFNRYSDDQQVFVGNLNQNLTETELESILSIFGKVIDVRIIINSDQDSDYPVPNYGFVVFEKKKYVERLLSKVKLSGLTYKDERGVEYRLNVEEKKAPQGRMYAGHSFYKANSNNINVNNYSQSSDNSVSGDIDFIEKMLKHTPLLDK